MRFALASLLCLTALACAREPHLHAVPPPARPMTMPEADGDARPMVLDMTTAQRDALASAMDVGVAVVSYTGHSLALLEGCNAKGDYGILSITPHTATFTLRAAGDVVATLPTTGAALAQAFARDASGHASLDVAETVGAIRRTTRRSIATGELAGTCTGATHFVAGATLGAFRVTSAAFSGTYGDPTLCAAASADASKAPGGCDAPIALELRGLDTDAPPGGAILARECPKGYVLSADACIEDDGRTPRECDAGDAASCVSLGESIATTPETACAAGDAKSCADLASRATDEATTVTDWDRACNGGMANACAREAEVLPDHLQAARLFARACDGGDARGCYGRGEAFAHGRGLPRDLDAAYALLDGACRAGFLRACAALGDLEAQGTPSHKADADQASVLWKQACDAGEAAGCAALGVALGHAGNAGIAVAELAASLGMSKVACERAVPPWTDGARRACARAGDMTVYGVGTAADAAGAFALFDRGCTDGDAKSCLRAADREARGEGTARDAAKAYAHYLAAWKEGDAAGATAAARLGAGGMSHTDAGADADPTPPATWAARACTRGDPVGCDLRAELGGLDAWTTQALERRACDGGVTAGCVHLAATASKADAAALVARACMLGDIASCPKADARKPEALEAACKTSRDAGACARLGSRYRDGEGVTASSVRAVALFDDACHLGDARACHAEAAMIRRGEGAPEDTERAHDLDVAGCTGCAGTKESEGLAQAEPSASTGTQEDGSAARLLLTRACDAADAAACTHLGLAYAETDPDRAAVAYARACAARDADGCLLLAKAYLSGAGLPADSLRATAIDQDMCDSGVAQGCGALASLLRDADPPDLAGAVRAATLACNELDFAGCRALALAFSKGYGVGADSARSVSIRETTCAAGDAAGCSSLGYDYFLGAGVPHAPARAASFFSAACELDRKAGCDALADLYAMGQGVTTDEARALSLYTRACGSGDEAACLSEGFMLYAAKGAAKDEDRATALFQQHKDSGTSQLEETCDRGVARDCTVAGVVFQRSSDNAAAAKWLRKGCGAGDEWACGYMAKTE